jgi:N-acetylneuraminic acid mutarotase
MELEMKRAILVMSAVLCSLTVSGQPTGAIQSWTAPGATQDLVTLQGSGGVTVSTAGSTIAIGAPSGDTTLIGGRYTEIDTPIDYWTATTTMGAPLGRYRHTAVWTGSRMIVWGGYNGSYLNDGGQYDPVANAWTPTTTFGAPSGRYGHTAVWTGSRMIVWGGFIDSARLNGGGQYDPVANAWTPTTRLGAPSGRSAHTAVWTGSKMIVWGGSNGSGDLNDGGQYDPVANTWTATTTTGAPSAREYHTAVWTGFRMIVWGGWGGSYPNDGGQYNPATNTWTATTTTGAPSARVNHTAVWTGSKMNVWGGYNGSYLDNGGQYDPVANAWTPTMRLGAPSGRYGHTAVWTGSRMIVWGGYGSGNVPLNDGGQYDPVASAWTAMTTTGAPSGRGNHTAVWTGSRMIVWGGKDGSGNLNDGGQWGPAPDPGCYSLTTGVSPDGSGTVSVNTGQNCSGGFTAGTNTSLTANPQPGWAFAGWLGSGGSFSNTEANPTTFTIAGNANVTALYVTGLTAQFSAAYEDHSIFIYSNVTAYKNVVFTASDAPSNVDSYDWDFGDGTAHGTGSTATHSFAPGSWAVKLTVTKRSASVSMSLNLTVVSPSEPPKWVVPGMAYVPGQVPGTLWQSDVTILNPDPTQVATYSLAFLDARNPVNDGSQLTWYAISVPPLGSVGPKNVLSGFFGQPLGAYGALMVRGDVAPLPPVITARTFNNGDPTKGTFGLSVPQESVFGGVTPQSSPAASVLIGLRQNAAAYTNLGLVNLHNDWPQVELDFFDGLSAAKLGSMTVGLNPYQSLQINGALQAAGYAGTSDLYTVQVRILQGTAVYPYATVIDAHSTDPIVVVPTEAPSNAYRLPGVVRLTGANGENWRSRVTVSNPSSLARWVHMVFSYVPCDTSGCASQVRIAGDVAMSPGQTQSWDDFVKVWLAVKGNIAVDDATSYLNSFLDVSPAAGDTNLDSLVVLGETYDDTPNGHVGLQIPGYTSLDGASQTGAYKRLALTGLASTTAYRTNLAIFVIAGSTGKWCDVHVYSSLGTKLRDIPVLVDSFSQINSGTLFGGLSGDLSGLSIVIDNIDDGVTVGGYATIIDNTSGDATFVKATPEP